MKHTVVAQTGFSFPVVSVQSLASSCSGDVPPQFLRPELLLEEVLVDDSLQIPMVDMGKLMVDGDEMSKLHLACKEWGFFQLTNHGVAEEVIEKMKTVIREFFQLPLEKKNAYAKPQNGIEGYGPNLLFSEDQKLEWDDTLFLQSLPASERTMKFWPQEPTSFREALDSYSWELAKLSKRLLKLMAENLGVNPQQLLNLFEDGRQAVRMNYYPPCVQASQVIGAIPHSDPGGLTLLVQVNEVEGLQIKKNGKWIPINPLPGAMIVNVGDVFEILSNGEYQSIEHRAVVNPEKERLSIAVFYSPGVGTIIGPLPELTKENGPLYKSVSREEYIKLVISRKPAGKNIVNQMKLD